MTNSNRKGSRAERELVNWLTENGWAAMRAPTSGGGTERDLPDIIAGRDGYSVAVELKTTGGDRAYFDPEEGDQLTRFAQAFGANAFLGVRFDEEHGDPSYGEDWPGFYFERPATVAVTESGRYSFGKETAHETAVSLPEL